MRINDSLVCRAFGDLYYVFFVVLVLLFLLLSCFVVIAVLFILHSWCFVLCYFVSNTVAKFADFPLNKVKLINTWEDAAAFHHNGYQKTL